MSPLTCNRAVLLSELLINWPIMAVMDAAVSCLPLSNLHVRAKVSPPESWAQRSTQLQLLMELLVPVSKVDGSIIKLAQLLSVCAAL